MLKLHWSTTLDNLCAKGLRLWNCDITGDIIYIFSVKNYHCQCQSDDSAVQKTDSLRSACFVMLDSQTFWIDIEAKFPEEEEKVETFEYD